MKKQNKSKKFLAENIPRLLKSSRQGKWGKKPTMIHVEAIDSQVLFRERVLLKQSEEFNKTSSPKNKQNWKKKTIQNNCFRTPKVNRGQTRNWEMFIHENLLGLWTTRVEVCRESASLLPGSVAPSLLLQKLGQWSNLARAGLPMKNNSFTAGGDWLDLGGGPKPLPGSIISKRSICGRSEWEILIALLTWVCSPSCGTWQTSQKLNKEMLKMREP